MHEQVRDFLRRMRARWPDVVAGARVVEFGSYDINGSAREALGAASLEAPSPPCLPLPTPGEGGASESGGRMAHHACGWEQVSAPTAWVGVDWRAGPGVDVVGLAHEFRPLTANGRPQEFDLAVSTEMLEHDPFWRESLRRMIEVVRPGGSVLLTCAGPGRHVHEVECAPPARTGERESGRAGEPHYRGLGLSQVVQWVREVEDFNVVYGEEHGTPSDTYLALIGRRQREASLHPPTRPVISVVVPCVGNVELTRRCVASLREMTAGAWELVLVENGSRAENREALADAATGRVGERESGRGPERVVFLSWDRMLGYPAAVNRGIAAASGDYVCLLNNDTEMRTPGWDTLLVETLEAGRWKPENRLPSSAAPHDGASAQDASLSVRTEIVSPVTDFVANPAQVGRWEEGGTPREARVLFFVCVLMRRELFARVGLLDEEFGLGNGEDKEFCRRVQAAGGRLLVDPGVFVQHAGHGTFRRLPAGMFASLLERNEALYQAKAGRGIIGG